MQILRYCRSCTGPRPRAAWICPWCHRPYQTKRTKPGRPFPGNDRAMGVMTAQQEMK